METFGMSVWRVGQLLLLTVCVEEKAGGIGISEWKEGQVGCQCHHYHSYHWQQLACMECAWDRMRHFGYLDGTKRMEGKRNMVAICYGHCIHFPCQTVPMAFTGSRVDARAANLLAPQCLYVCVCAWNIWRGVKLLPWLTELLFLIRFFAITRKQFRIFYQAFIQSPFQLQGVWRLIS